MKVWMSVAVASSVMLTDGDCAFLRVDNRRPAHALEPGVVHRAKNKRFDDGKPGPRFGIARDSWGMAGHNAIADGSTYAEMFPGLLVWKQVTLVAGTEYSFIPGNAYFLTPLVGDALEHAVFSGRFTAIQANYYVVALKAEYPAGTAVTARILRFADTCAYKRFNDPSTDTDNCVLLTSDWRDRPGEDGGRGRAWRIQSGNTPQEIPLNGHSIWGTARLIQCHNALVMLRHGNERLYFSAANVDDAANDRITLPGAPSWGIGTARRVRFELDQDGSGIYGSAAPAAGNYYYAKRISGNIIELYTDLGLTNKLDWDASPAPNGRFYLELALDPPPIFGNAAPPLVLQPGPAGELPFDYGWQTAPANVAITDTDAANDLVTAPNHRLSFGDSVSGTAIGGVTWPKYAAPQSTRTVRLYDTAEDALADDGSTGLVNLTTDDETGSLWKTSAAGLPIRGGREGIYLNGRLWIITGDDEVLMSDPFDFLHYTQFMSQVPANQGEAGRANWLAALGEDVLCIGKDQKVIVITGVAGPIEGWAEGTITDEYGGIAPLAAIQAGTDIQFASRKGWASVIRTAAGERLGVIRTLSRDIPLYLSDIDWSQAGLMAAETWGSRVFWAVPTKGQTNPVNNRVLVLNMDNSLLYLEQQVVAGEVIGGVRQYAEGARGPDSWEGEWTGDLLTPYAFARLTVNQEERLTFVTPDGIVCWFHDGWDDAGAAIEDEVITRGYFGSKDVLALRGLFRWETFQPKLSAWIRSAGYNEEEQLEGFDELEYDRATYLVDGATAYDPNTSTIETFDAPHRADYSPAPEELLVARLDVHQTLAEPFRCRVRDHAIQLRVLNAQGSARLCGTTVQALPVGISATRKT